MTFESLGLPSPEGAKLRLLSDPLFVFEIEYGFAASRLDDKSFRLVANSFMERWQRAIGDHITQAHSASSLEAATIPLEELMDWYGDRLGLLRAYEISRAGIWLANLLEADSKQKDA